MGGEGAQEKQQFSGNDFIVELAHLSLLVDRQF